MNTPVILSDDDQASMSSMPTMRAGGSGLSGEPVLGRIDQYEIIRKLGGGGFGAVYLARDSHAGVEVALKTLHPLLKRDVEEMDRLREKFRLVCRLSHPNIASPLVLHPCRDIDVRDGDARRDLRLSPGDSVMVMRYAPGVTLSKWRKAFDGGTVQPALALEIGRQASAALDYAHSENIVHRDVKPGNIMVETLGLSTGLQDAQDSPGAVADGRGNPVNSVSKLRVRLLDFGLAAEIRSSMARISTEKPDCSGTRPYMAPEQWQGRKQDGRTDQYALACVLYELLSGAPPFASVFETGDPEIMMVAVERRTPDPVSGLPAAANAALLRALAKDPDARFPSCAAFVGTLASALGGSGVPAFRPERMVSAVRSLFAKIRAKAALCLSRIFAVLSMVFKTAKRKLRSALARFRRRRGGCHVRGEPSATASRRRRAKIGIAMAVLVAIAGGFACLRMFRGDNHVAPEPEPEPGIWDALGNLVDVGVRAYVESSYENETKCRTCGGTGMVHIQSPFGSVLHVPCRACNGTGKAPQSNW